MQLTRATVMGKTTNPKDLIQNCPMFEDFPMT